MKKASFILSIFLTSLYLNVEAEAPKLKNQKDSKGLKQGIWNILENNKLMGIETYLNDTLNGPYKYGDKRNSMIGQYKKGLRDGLWKWYDYDTILLMVVKYELGKEIWSAYPLADTAFHTPMKGFGIYSDSVLIQCPYANGKIWYNRLFINKKPIGTHLMYYPNGKLKFEHNYETAKIKVFDKHGKLITIKDDDINRHW